MNQSTSPTPNRIVAFVDDMFFAAKIRATATAIDGEVVFLRSQEEFEKALQEGAASLIIVDLNGEKLDPIELVKAIKSSELRRVPVVGFLSHVQVDLMKRAREAGVDHVMPRSAFSQRLPQILAGNFDTTPR